MLLLIFFPADVFATVKAGCHLVESVFRNFFLLHLPPADELIRMNPASAFPVVYRGVSEQKNKNSAWIGESSRFTARFFKF